MSSLVTSSPRKLQYQTWVFSCGAGLDSLRKLFVTLVAYVLLLYPWANISRMVIIRGLSILSWVRLSIIVLTLAAGIAPSYIMKSSQQRGSFQFSISLIFFLVLWVVCDSLRDEYLPPGSVGPPRTVTLSCDVWGSLGHLWPTTLGWEMSHSWYNSFQLVIDGFWKEISHYPNLYLILEMLRFSLIAFILFTF